MPKPGVHPAPATRIIPHQAGLAREIVQGVLVDGDGVRVRADADLIVIAEKAASWPARARAGQHQKAEECRGRAARSKLSNQLLVRRPAFHPARLARAAARNERAAPRPARPDRDRGRAASAMARRQATVKSTDVAGEVPVALAQADV